jgi:hypothetical protein
LQSSPLAKIIPTDDFAALLTNCHIFVRPGWVLKDGCKENISLKKLGYQFLNQFLFDRYFF